MHTILAGVITGFARPDQVVQSITSTLITRDDVIGSSGRTDATPDANWASRYCQRTVASILSVVAIPLVRSLYLALKGGH